MPFLAAVYSASSRQQHYPCLSAQCLSCQRVRTCDMKEICPATSIAWSLFRSACFSTTSSATVRPHEVIAYTLPGSRSSTSPALTKSHTAAYWPSEESTIFRAALFVVVQLQQEALLSYVFFGIGVCQDICHLFLCIQCALFHRFDSYYLNYICKVAECFI